MDLLRPDRWWFELIEALRGKRVPFWSRETGLSDESFVVADVSQDGVLLEGGNPISRFEIFRI